MRHPSRPPHTDDPSIITSVPSPIDWSKARNKWMDDDQKTWAPARKNRDKVQSVTNQGRRGG